MGLEINTIDRYFSKIYSEKELAEFKKKLSAKLLSYKFPSEICLSSSYQDTSTLLGTLTFEELDNNGYPTYSGDVVKSEGLSLGSIYSTILIFDRNRWVFTLTEPKEALDIIIGSERTTSLDPTKVDYDGISRPTAGACPR
jgi:hypothetical protein